jgi:hypothetical protein
MMINIRNKNAIGWGPLCSRGLGQISPIPPLQAVLLAMFPCHKIHKYTWTSPDGRTHIQIGHVLLDEDNKYT